MGKETLIPVGTVSKSRGLKGELIVTLTHSDIQVDKGFDKVWLGDSSNHLHPWQIDYLNVSDNRAILKLKKVNSRQEAEYLQGIQVYLPAECRLNSELLALIGFRIKLLPSDEIRGEVTAIDLSGLQPLMIVTVDSQEYAVPAVDEFLEEIDRERKIIGLKVIEGLFSL